MNTKLRIYTYPALVISVALLAACGSQPKTAATSPLASTTPALEQFLSDASRSRQEGARGVERDTYRKAAQAYPTSKEPWLKLAESYFEGQDYGNAILAAQEVLQRDASDKVANSLLAVSGLRVSSAALLTLRGQQDLSVDTRDQAQDVVKTLREVLGEPVLVPKPAEPRAASNSVTPRKPVRPVRPVTAATAPAAGAPAAPAAAAPKPAKAANPFDTLK